MFRFVVTACSVIAFCFTATAQTDASTIDTKGVSEAPKKRITANFRGKADVEPDRTTAKFVSSGTVLNKNDPFLTFNVKHSRTGVLKNDLVYRNAMNVLESEKTVPAGTPMYANSYVLSPSRFQFGQIAWCAIRSEEEKSLCILWKGKPRKVLWPKDKDALDTVAKYVIGSKNDSHYYVPTLDFMSTHEGMIPEIEEKPIDFERDFLVTVRFERFKKSRVRLNVRLSDGDKNIRYTGLKDDLDKVRLNANGEAIFKLLGQTVKLTKLDKKEARFEIVNP